MSQHDYNIQNATFPSTRSDINDALGAIATNNSGNSAPATTYANQWWFDSDDNKLYMRNKDNDAWVEILTIGATSDKVESIGSVYLLLLLLVMMMLVTLQTLLELLLKLKMQVMVQKMYFYILEL